MAQLPAPLSYELPLFPTTTTMSRFFALSDVHVDHKKNMEWIKSLDKATHSSVRSG